MKEKYVVTLRGANVWHDCVLVCIIDSTNDLSLRSVASYIQAQFDTEVYNFRSDFGVLSATTSRKDVKMFIERTTVLDNISSDKPF